MSMFVPISEKVSFLGKYAEADDKMKQRILQHVERLNRRKAVRRYERQAEVVARYLRRQGGGAEPA